MINLICDDRFTTELADIFDKLATRDITIIDKLIEMLDRNINISKILVSILMRIEKSDPDFVEKTCNKILSSSEKGINDQTNTVINFIAYAPALKSFAKYKDKFLVILKQIYLGTNVSVATKAFMKLYNEEIRNFVIGCSFTYSRKAEALGIFEKNFDATDPILFAYIYTLKFDKNEKICSKAHELWIKSFRQGVINAIIPHIIIMCYYHAEDELLFEAVIYDFMSKYYENMRYYKLLVILNRKVIVCIQKFWNLNR